MAERYQIFNESLAFPAISYGNIAQLTVMMSDEELTLVDYRGQIAQYSPDESLERIGAATAYRHGGLENSGKRFLLRYSDGNLSTLAEDMKRIGGEYESAASGHIQALQEIVQKEEAAFTQNFMSELQGAVKRQKEPLWVRLGGRPEYDVNGVSRSRVAKLHGFRRQVGGEAHGVSSIVSGQNGEKGLWPGEATLFILGRTVTYPANAPSLSTKAQQPIPPNPESEDLIKRH